MPAQGKRGLLSPRALDIYHERTRTRGVNSLVYWPARVFVKSFILVYFRLRRLGFEHVPGGGVILAANHRSFLDPFVIGCCIGRPIYFVAKQELFENRSRSPSAGWAGWPSRAAPPWCRSPSPAASTRATGGRSSR